ncbi:MAG: hypothetical protein A3J55_04460 [Candidatus Ryanbacteria bacterium RIFCSPHIGHO2_02_FULL_45_17b]|uniref:Uncharacterized protein n=1 Tax=Candidatus Ryanbacteria bacterium RIFCSPHIGHO2_01_FULL_45_22 TaxID=1802114 RepID=A0A1G2G2A6_9BACT|nr:MAG: hypothetical protein A2719_05035 [Candidatus Ryanbacteria bacterium RIFCSPHIGHO2_01_FULL_45_22]OGZ47597.1 MAG: hypothetical protein A3J55_04460 [Candidatus Ryanbacteria bacterium RIFCSPHIGHO2_02_FULL_45_17b]
MDFINSIQNIQQKPRHVRQRILFISVAICMVVIIISWLMVTSRRISGTMTNIPYEEIVTSAGASPLEILKTTFAETIESIKAHAKK